jgi:hypothetical protein
MKKSILDGIVEQALEQALAALSTRARDMVEQALEQALRARVQALLGEEVPATPTPTPEAPVRAKAKVAATSEEVREEPTPKVRRRKAKEATLTPDDDLTAILESAKVALAKYSGVSTPRGKPLSEVLYRRLRKTLEHAQSLGRTDIPALARSALAHIASDPRGVAMGSWQALAARLGLPIPVAQA